MVGVHPEEDKPGFQVELAEYSVGGCSRLEKLAPPFLPWKDVWSTFYFITASPSLILHNVADPDLFQIRLPLDSARRRSLPSCQIQILHYIMIYRYIFEGLIFVISYVQIDWIG